MNNGEESLRAVADQTFALFERAWAQHRARLEVREVGTVTRCGQGVALVDGLPGIRSEEIVRFPGDVLGMAFNLDPQQVGVILLDESEQIVAGSEVRRTERVLDVPVGEALLGRVVDPVGRPLDGKGALRTSERLRVERDAPPIMHRAPVEIPLQTGLKVVDALIPIGRGQRELILGDRQTGKSTIAVDTIMNQEPGDVLCVYCAIGQQRSAVSKTIAELRRRGAMRNCVVVFASGENAPGLRFVAPYAAMSIGEYFRDHGRDALVVFDDLTRHARAYRELSLLLRRPPGREAYPGDIFYVHSRLLERATHLRAEHGGGSLTALPIIETQAQNLSAYIPTNLISITDGQIYLSPQLFRKGFLPAIDVGKSVSRVGGKTQVPAYREVAGDLRLSYSQFEELEAFSRFGTRLDEETRESLERGRRVREILKQPEHEPAPVLEQLAVLVAVNVGVLDDVPLEAMAETESRIRRAAADRLATLGEKIRRREELNDEDREKLAATAREAVSHGGDEESDADPRGDEKTA
jgi:F-type H+-transporting ATPase subunit alpha